MRKVLVGLLFLLPGAIFAEEADIQLRTPFHLQRGRVAAWMVVPDWTLARPRLLLVAGPLWRHEDKTRGQKEWVEVLAGGLATRNGRIAPILNVRASRSSPNADFYVEALHNFDMRRTILVPNIGFRIWNKLRLGGEMEVAFGKGEPDFGLGPRFTAPFKCGPARCSIAGTYFLKQGGNVARLYMPVNF